MILPYLCISFAQHISHYYDEECIMNMNDPVQHTAMMLVTVLNEMLLFIVVDDRVHSV